MIKLWIDELFYLYLSISCLYLLSITETKNISMETSMTNEMLCSMGLFCREVKLKILKVERSIAFLTNKVEILKKRSKINDFRKINIDD